LRPALDPAETAAAQLRARGHDPAEVTDVVLTHLDLDHAGGVTDFPGARVHVLADELAAARARRSLRERTRYVPGQWPGARWDTHAVEGEEWLGFAAVSMLADDVLMVPLVGHTRGHCGVAVRRPGGGWFLHAGDAYFSRHELESPPSCPAGLSVFQTLLQMDGPARHHNQERLRSLHAEHGPDSGAAEVVTVFSAHDAEEYDALDGTTH
ncbi:MAG: MBL fold metallo-hydrolase, partial [Marmoricola sp.]